MERWKDGMVEWWNGGMMETCIGEGWRKNFGLTRFDEV
jgi:hypothetical protein